MNKNINKNNNNNNSNTNPKVIIDKFNPIDDVSGVDNEESMTLIERFKNIEYTNPRDAWDFFYLESGRDYDLSKVSDLFELYYFNVFFGYYMKNHETYAEQINWFNKKEKLPDFLKVVKKAVQAVDEYITIKEFTEKAVNNTQCEDFMYYILRLIKDSVASGKLVHIKSYNDDDLSDDEVHRDRYFTQDEDVEKFFFQLLQIVYELFEFAVPIKLEISKPRLRGSDVEDKTVKVYRRTSDGHVIDEDFF